MTKLNNEQRAKRIYELQEQINSLNYDKVYIDADLFFAKEIYHQDFDEAKRREIIDLQLKLDAINKQIMPLFVELRGLQIVYWVEYSGEVTNRDGSTYLHNQGEYFYLEPDCTIDTKTNGWNPYMSNPCVQELLKEVQMFLYRHRYSQFIIRHIRRM